MRKILLMSILSLMTTQAFATGPRVLGLICDQESDSDHARTNMLVTVVNSVATIQVENGLVEGQQVTLKIPAASVKPILEGKLALLNNNSFIDKASQSRIDFKVDGTEFDGTPRLAAVVSSGQVKFRLTSCSVRTLSTGHY